MHRMVVSVLALSLTAAMACGDSDQGAAPEQPEAAGRLEVTSPDLEDGGDFPEAFTCDGENVSPALRWTRAENAEEYVILMIDRDAPGGIFVHWKLFEIDPERSSVGQGTAPGEAVEGINSFGSTDYAGPCPPEGSRAHTYEITVYALNRALELAPDADLRELLDQMECCLEAAGTLKASYAR
jgi:Raf kinase inhibitor-like YbhB/YbcL family protein